MISEKRNILNKITIDRETIYSVFNYVNYVQ